MIQSTYLIFSNCKFNDKIVYYNFIIDDDLILDNNILPAVINGIRCGVYNKREIAYWYGYPIKICGLFIEFGLIEYNILE